MGAESAYSVVCKSWLQRGSKALLDTLAGSK